RRDDSVIALLRIDGVRRIHVFGIEPGFDGYVQGVRCRFVQIGFIGIVGIVDVVFVDAVDAAGIDAINIDFGDDGAFLGLGFVAVGRFGLVAFSVGSGFAVESQLRLELRNVAQLGQRWQLIEALQVEVV